MARDIVVTIDGPPEIVIILRIINQKAGSGGEGSK
jgi:hypothetical protein